MTPQQLADWLGEVSKQSGAVLHLDAFTRQRLAQAAGLLSLPLGFIEVDAGEISRNDFRKIYGLPPLDEPLLPEA